jgi:hypothetical protein
LPKIRKTFEKKILVKKFFSKNQMENEFLPIPATLRPFFIFETQPFKNNSPNINN